MLYCCCERFKWVVNLCNKYSEKSPQKYFASTNLSNRSLVKILASGSCALIEMFSFLAICWKHRNMLPDWSVNDAILESMPRKSASFLTASRIIVQLCSIAFNHWVKSNDGKQRFGVCKPTTNPSAASFAKHVADGKNGACSARNVNAKLNVRFGQSLNWNGFSLKRTIYWT